jgi:predicted SAM-dependent methyltransferase
VTSKRGPIAHQLTTDVSEVTRLNCGCGKRPVPRWINVDKNGGPGVDITADVRKGLPLDDGSVDYAVSIHFLQEIPLDDLVPTLRELHRVLKPGGTIRLVLPDLDKGIRAYLDEKVEHFLVPDDDARSLGGKFIYHMLWYGHSRVLFTYDFIEELLLKAGFARVERCVYGETASGISGIVELDNRENESLFVEAVK